MKIRVKLKEEHLRELVAGRVACVTVDDAAIVQASQFVMRPTIEIVLEDIGFERMAECIKDAIAETEAP